MIECSFEIGVQDIFCLLLNRVEDRFDRIVTGAPWPEPVGIGFKARFPFGFEGEFGQMLPRTLNHDGNPQGTLLAFPRLWYSDSPPVRRDIFPVLGVDLVRHDRTLRWFHGFDAIDPCGFLALVVLCDPANGQEPG